MQKLLYLIKQEVQGEDVLNKKIKNPVTGRLIKVSSALNYPEDQKVYKIAKNMIDKSNIKNADLNLKSTNKPVAKVKIKKDSLKGAINNKQKPIDKINSIKSQLKEIYKKEININKKAQIKNYLNFISKKLSNNTTENLLNLEKQFNLKTSVDKFFGDGQIIDANIYKFQDSFYTHIISQDIYSSRTFNPKTKIVEMELTLKNPLITEKGFGTKVFSNQVKEFKAAGFKKLINQAEGNINDKEYNGYYTWARLGYNFRDKESLEELKSKLQNQKDPQLKKVESLSQLMSFQKGRDFWKENGFSFRGEFDLDDNSESMMILKKYMEQK